MGAPNLLLAQGPIQPRYAPGLIVGILMMNGPFQGLYYNVKGFHLIQSKFYYSSCS